MDLEVRASGGSQALCALCRDALTEPMAACSSCGVRVHAECARELGGCPTLACAGAWGAAVEEAFAPLRARSRARAAAACLGLVALATLAAWGSTFRAPRGAERVLGGWFTGHGSLPAAVVATFGAAAPPGLGGAPVEALVFTADGARLISAARGELIWWDVASGREVGRGRLEGQGSTPWLAPSPDGRRLLVPVGDVAELWDVERMERTAWLPHAPTDLEAPPRDEPWRATQLVAGVCADDRALLAYASPGALRIVDLTGAERACLVTAGERISRVAFAPDARRVVASSSAPTWGDERRQVWDLGGDRPPRDVLWSDVLAPMTFSRDGRRLAWHDVHGTRLLDVDADRLLVEVPQTGIGYGVDAPVALSPDERRAAVASYHGVEVHDLEAGRLAARYPGHGGRRVAVRAVAWSPDGARFATGGDDQRVIVWRAP